MMDELQDGGKTWTDIAAAKAVKSNPDYTAYHWIEFQTPTRAIASGTVVPPRPFDSGEPAWIDPEHAAERRQWPTLMITLESRDGGTTWTSDTAPTFGYPRRFRFGPVGRAMAVLQFENAFEYPSEVYVVEKGKSRRIMREKQLLVSDVGWLGPSGHRRGGADTFSMHQIPVPGKLKVLTTDNFFKMIGPRWTWIGRPTRARRSSPRPAAAPGSAPTPDSSLNSSRNSNIFPRRCFMHSLFTDVARVIPDSVPLIC